jgi:hypothetical protein
MQQPNAAVALQAHDQKKDIRYCLANSFSRYVQAQ